jgi:hypothetical protein
MKLYSFTFMKGVVKLDYPFMEVLNCLNEITTKTFVAVGSDADQTEEMVRSLPKCQIIKTKWEDSRVGDGGTIFSSQANIALGELRKQHRDEGAWAIFLHSDEMFHPDDYSFLLKEIAQAEAQGFDAISYPFIHFWKDHYHMAINKRWHPAEVRVFKLDSTIVCHGDAQGFKGAKKEMLSQVSLLHYGHVRSYEHHQAKQNEILRRIRPSDKFDKYKKREEKAFAKTKTFPVLRGHPLMMKDRILRLGDRFELESRDILYIVGDAGLYRTEIKEKIKVKKIYWVGNIAEVPREHRRQNMVVINASSWQKIRYNLRVPKAMESKVAKPFSPDFYLILCLSQKGFSLA